MNIAAIEELERILARDGIDPDAYSLAEGTWEDRYCLEHSASGWTVYFVERGTRLAALADAGEDLLQRLLKNPTTRA